VGRVEGRATLGIDQLGHRGRIMGTDNGKHTARRGHRARYCCISPCRNEQDYMRRTLESVTGQSVPPALWVVVDDGSTDDTPKILEEYAARFDYLRVVRRADRGLRSVGPGVIDAFYAGYETIAPGDFEYLCKLDLDLDLPPRYFERLIERMEAEPRLGTCSGKPYYVDHERGRLISEWCGDEMSVGMTKFYRTACFEQLGGFVREVMWDGIDCHHCRLLGWTARSWDDPELRFVHLRQMGSSEHNVLVGRRRHGYGQYFMGTSPEYMTVSAVYRMSQPPCVVGGLAMMWGYLESALARKPRYDDPVFRRFLRGYQRSILRTGKAAATETVERRQSAAWRPPR
jgi:glycosyltransferase involved in cell wall biosynthesis